MLWVILPAARGQTCHPGGVTGAIKWYSTDTAVASPGLRNQLDSNYSVVGVEHATVTSLNFHPALVFSGNPLRIDLGDRDLRSSSYFTVYQTLDTAGENSIWHMTSNQQTSLVLTTDRMADLSVYKYMNYKDVVRANPKVNIYVQHKDDSIAPTNQWWNIGVKPAAPQLPIVNLKGLVPEIIAYDRVLNSTERLQVASYLALKYGITITEPNATYLNSNADKVWDGYDYPAWHRNIAGICRDDSSGLYQTIAGSSNAPGLLTLNTKETLTNNTFLLWGDNGKPLATGEPISGLPALLQKTWLMKTYGNAQPFTTDLLLDTKAVDAALPIHPVYWLVIDPTGKGKFNTAGVDFIKMDNLDGQGKALFKNVRWDKDGSGKDVWGIVAGQELMLAAAIHQPGCTSPGTGSMAVKILGGQAPYQLIIQKNGGPLMNSMVADAAARINITDLATGKYRLLVTDAAQRTYTDSFYINNEDGPLPVSIDANYTLRGGRTLKLNAAEDMPDGVSWEWSGPSNFQSFNPQVNITAPGTYTLRSSKNGCSNVQDIKVTAIPDNVLYDITVYPNPSPASYNARITLDKPAAVTMSVYGPDGKMITVQKGNERAHYLFTGELTTAGVYRLVFTSGLSKATKTLVIAK
jgi:hypothetical protein